MDNEPDDDARREHVIALRRARGLRAAETRRRRRRRWEWRHPLGPDLFHCVHEPTIATDAR